MMFSGLTAVFINVLNHISSPKLNNQFFFNFQSIECMNMLLGEPQHLNLNYFAVANAKNLYVKIKSIFVNYKVKILSF